MKSALSLNKWFILAATWLFVYGSTWEIAFGESILALDSGPASEESELSIITGTVTGTNGSLEGISVFAWVLDDEGWEPAGWVFTNDDGEFEITGLSSGIYRLWFSDPSGNYLSETYAGFTGIWPDEDGTDIEVDESTVVGGIDAVLTAVSRITGTVTGPEEQPLKYIEVIAYRWTGSWWQSAGWGTTNAYGEYELAGLRAGTYRVKFEDWEGPYVNEVYNGYKVTWPDQGGTDIVVGEGATIDGIDAVLTLGAEITGTVTNSEGLYLENISVSAHRWNGSWWDQVSWADTDEYGEYVLTGLAAGSYRVRFYDYDHVFASQMFGNVLASWPDDGGDDIEVSESGEVTEINASLLKYASISGRITDAEGVPIPDVLVSLHGSWLGGWSDEEGCYFINRIQPGTHTLVAEPSWNSPFLGQWYSEVLLVPVQSWWNDDPPQGVTELLLESGENVSDKNFQLDRGASLTGTVTTSEGISLPGSAVVAVNQTHNLIAESWVDMDGRYTIEKLLPGEYLVHVKSFGFQNMWWDNAFHRDDADSFSMVVEEFYEANFNLRPGQSPARVWVTSEPEGAEIHLNFWPTGKVTPASVDVNEVGSLDLYGFSMAPYVITVKNEGSPRPPPQAVWPVEADTVEVSFDLTSDEVGSLSIVTTPEGADVYVDYAAVREGTTPITVENLLPGSHTILLRKAGYLQPRPIVAWIDANEKTEIEIPLELESAENQMMVNALSVPAGIPIYIDYLPSGQVTNAIVDRMDPASHEGLGWHSASHTVLLRGEDLPRMAPRYVPEGINFEFESFVNLPLDPIAQTDSNGDGIPDWLWELYGYDLADLPNLNDIADESGMTYGDKLRAGLVPGDPDSRLAVGEIEISENSETGRDLTFVFDSVPGRLYVVQARESLTDGVWTNISGIIQPLFNQTLFSIQIPAETGNLFYRVIVLTP